jgi:hypothetical protein
MDEDNYAKIIEMYTNNDVFRKLNG